MPVSSLSSLPALLRRFGNQHLAFSSMTFRELREIFRAVAPRKNEIFGDAGAGYGHVVFLRRLRRAVPLPVSAIEILPARCAAMRRSRTTAWAFATNRRSSRQ